ncbi:MAG: aspartate carbamoyltransferase [Spirochaetia bacterium]|jgi:aspartate carbamoyltransferase|nr:aspartate carbamoyltransferase [Spirochaetales bacterium]MDX9783589.1 aspartate carbamoyltransferase [Spirochaetia bacterium]
MKRSGPFKGRTISVVNDLSLDEQRYLYRKSRELKTLAMSSGDCSAFKINDLDYQVYLIFMEDSTRTRESFRNAAKFLGCRTNVFDAASSSFNKNESITDAVKMLYGYSADSCFVMRTKMEGACRWLEQALSRYAELSGKPRPGFINGGDGKHEHPTQELLDEFSFLEHMEWKEDHIHLALTGDLYHGRTIHSKADGLRIFKTVEVDLIAPELLSMPSYYVEKMKDNGFSVRIFESLDEYLASGTVAPIWYFTRLQLERMGESVLERAPSLRRSVTFRKDMLGLLPEGTRFYHPLPRDRMHPTIPPFLDDLPLNGWDAQSANGYWTRIVEIGMVSGLLGQDFEGAFAMEPEIVEDFILETQVEEHRKPEYKVGIKPVEEGIVIDHIASGQPVEDIWSNIEAVRKILKLNVRSSQGVYHSFKGPEVYKGIISLPDITSFGEKDLKKLSAIAPGCTLNLIRNSKVAKKFRLSMPPRIYGFDEISCKNENCISNPKHNEGVPTEFLRKSGSTFVCRYCEKEHNFREIWDI